MYLLIFLLVFPLVAAFILLATRDQARRSLIVKVAAVVVSLTSIGLFLCHARENVRYFSADAEPVSQIMFLIELGLAAYIFFLGYKSRKYAVSLLILAQTLLMGYFEVTRGSQITVYYDLFVDKFSLIMVLLIGLIGSLIAIYAIGYMKDFHEHHHPELADKRPFFFFIVFVFLSAMFGIVLSNNLLWLYFFWEITTLCSFFLIGYKGTEECLNNAFTALLFNLIGGLAFASAIVYLYSISGTIELDKLLLLGRPAMIPVILLSIAGLTKSAQMPFSSWLVKAMVAPTPVSALLHSSTMVKAGVYLLIKCAPLLKGTPAGTMVAFLGSFTFLLTSFIAISQSDAKKVLAYSTIANLGLIVTCAGIGSYEAVWAGVLLIIFHAIAKCLLFLCVGVAEHKLGSRSIEAMEGLIQSMPRIAWMLLVGMAGMFLAPFGMLISKWAALKALVDQHTYVVVFVIFGSSATLFFWVKWMGSILAVPHDKKDIEQGISREEWEPLYILAFLTIGICLFFPVVSYFMIEPYVLGIYGDVTRMSPGNLIIMAIMLGLVLIFPFSLPGPEARKKARFVGPYLAGANTAELTSFNGSLGMTREVALKNYYLADYFGERSLLKIGYVFSILMLIILLLLIFL